MKHKHKNVLKSGKENERCNFKLAQFWWRFFNIISERVDILFLSNYLGVTIQKKRILKKKKNPSPNYENHYEKLLTVEDDNIISFE